MMRVCVNDNQKMVFTVSGVVALEFKDRARTQPYKLWHADLYECGKCGCQILADFGQVPYLEEFEPNFYEKLNELKNKGKKIIEFY